VESRGAFSTFLAGLGGALAMAGTLLPWASVRYNPKFIGVELSSAQQVRHVAGVDLSTGLGTMIWGIAVSVAVIGALLLSKRGLLGTAAAAALAVIGLAVLELVRLKTDVLHGSRNPYARNPALGDRKLGRLFEVSPGYGLALVLGGSALALVAAVVAIRRTRSS
jgi:hypothetical protein